MVVKMLRNFVQTHSIEHHIGHVVYDLRGDFIKYKSVLVMRILQPAVSGKRTYVLAVASLHVKHFPNLF